MKAVSERTGEARQNQQINHSAWRLFLRWLGSPAGHDVWNKISAFVFAVALATMMYFVGVSDGKDVRAGAIEAQLADTRAALAIEIAVNRERSIENGCLGMAILAHLEPRRWPLPPWCAPVLEAIPARRGAP